MMKSGEEKMTEERKMYERRYGAKYDKTLSTTEIAKRFRADVKADKTLKGVKLSVRTRRFAGGSSIDVDIVRVPFEAYLPEGAPRPMMNLAMDNTYTEEMLMLRAKLDEMLQAYNHDGSEIMYDYFDVKFYGHVTIRVEREPVAPKTEPVKAENIAHETFLMWAGAL